MAHEQTNDASDFAQLTQLQEEILALETERELTEQRVQHLRMTENVAMGVINAQAIFQAQQNKLRLDVEIQMRQNKINRIKQGIDGLDAPPPLSCFQ